jgi:uncharacterized membrane protein
LLRSKTIANEKTINDGIKSAAAGVTSVLAALVTALHVGSAGDVTTLIGLIVTGLTSLVSAYFLGRKIAVGATTDPQGTLPL